MVPDPSWSLLGSLPHFLHIRPVAKNEGGGVQAVAETCGRWAVLEDMAQVTAATGAEDLGADHAVGGISQFGDVLLGEGLVEARPTGSGMKLGARREEREVAAGAKVDAGLVIIEQVAAEGDLGSLGSQNAVGFEAKLFFPLGIGLHHAWHVGDGPRFFIGAHQTYGDPGGGGVGRLGHGGGGVAIAPDHGEKGNQGQEMKGAHGETIAQVGERVASLRLVAPLWLRIRDGCARFFVFVHFNLAGVIGVCEFRAPLAFNFPWLLSAWINPGRIHCRTDLRCRSQDAGEREYRRH